MSLILTILNKPNPGQEISSAFHEDGTIGRAPNNTWVLVDPERLTSSKHAQIHSRNGEYFLADTSTNGVFINGSRSPLGKGNSVKLNHGDKVKMGEYDMSVTIQADESLPLGDPDSSPFGHTMNGTGSPPGLETSISPNELGRINDTSTLGIGGDNSLDPLAVLNGSAQASPTSKGTDIGNIDDIDFGSMQPLSPFDTATPLSEQQLAAGTSGDNASPMQYQFEPQQSRPAAPETGVGGSSTIPDDWEFGAAKAPVRKGASPAKQETSPSSPKWSPAKPEQSPDSLPSINDLLAGIIPATSPIPFFSDAPAKVESTNDTTSHPPANNAFSTHPIPHLQSPSSRRQTTASSTSAGTTVAMQNLLSGMGLEHLNLSAEEEDTLALEAGQLVRASVEGLIAVLRARATIKSEFRMSMTTIQAKENNPLKFSPTGMDALNHMFSPATSSYMPAVQAVGESFNDMEAHMIAVMAGMQTALHTVLKRFDPIMLERDFESREKTKGFSLGSKKAKYWGIYNTHYKEIIASVEDDFHTLFGDEFTRAYQEQIAKLKTAKNNQN